MVSNPLGGAVRRPRNAARGQHRHAVPIRKPSAAYGFAQQKGLPCASTPRSGPRSSAWLPKTAQRQCASGFLLREALKRRGRLPPSDDNGGGDQLLDDRRSGLKRHCVKRLRATPFGDCRWRCAGQAAIQLEKRSLNVVVRHHSAAHFPPASWLHHHRVQLQALDLFRCRLGFEFVVEGADPHAVSRPFCS